ncbi:MAG: hypothetical protein ACYS8W_11800 [Planctomycetota bacterium]
MRRITGFALIFIVVVAGAFAVLAAKKEVYNAEQKAALSDVQGLLGNAVGEESLSLYELAWILNGRRKSWARGGPRTTHNRTRNILRGLRETLVERIRTRFPDYDTKPKRKREPLILRNYEVSDIVFGPRDFSLYRSGLGASPQVALRDMGGTQSGGATSGKGGATIDLGDSDEELTPGVGSEELIELIESRLAAESDEGSIRYSNGQLIVRKTEAIHKKIQDFMSGIREQIGFVVTMEVKFLRIDRTFFRDFMEKNGILIADNLSGELADELLKNAGKEKPVQIITDHEITAYETQNVLLREGKQVSVMTDYEISTSGVIPVINPVIDNLNLGLVAGLRPIICGDRKSVQITVRGCYTELLEPVREFKTKAGPVQQPEIHITKLGTTIIIPDGKTGVVAGVLTGEGCVGDPLVLLVKPTIGRAAQSK